MGYPPIFGPLSDRAGSKDRIEQQNGSFGVPSVIASTRDDKIAQRYIYDYRRQREERRMLVRALINRCVRLP